ncbi:hypothetical protein TeGR_g224 [Tetraparma gracilis]|uniref:very-long-chain (3R)-3-hydroxyacyl-CoA dehydratase n=1 Tax=Tetraparma gracilis TaxID=2962635 RepID=A0ABQ6N8J7_9STRA|nr:hypothetical protein TeGR_g224 [Tetraparma gracilis]
MSLKTSYLFLYNCLQSLGWSSVLYTVSSGVILGSPLPSTALAATPAVAYLQGLAALELAHASLGLVSGSASSAFMQLFGRNIVLFGYVLPASLASSPVAAAPVLSLYFAWALSEVIRYPFYALSLLGGCPGALTWLRYTAFIALYPVGIFSECVCVYLSLEVVAPMLGERLGVDVGVALPVGTAAYCAFAYGYCGVLLYKYMLKQRRKVLGPVDRAAGKKKKA